MFPTKSAPCEMSIYDRPQSSHVYDGVINSTETLVFIRCYWKEITRQNCRHFVRPLYLSPVLAFQFFSIQINFDPWTKRRKSSLLRSRLLDVTQRNIQKTAAKETSERGTSRGLGTTDQDALLSVPLWFTCVVCANTFVVLWGREGVP